MVQARERVRPLREQPAGLEPGRPGQPRQAPQRAALQQEPQREQERAAQPSELVPLEPQQQPLQPLPSGRLRAPELAPLRLAFQQARAP